MYACMHACVCMYVCICKLSGQWSDQEPLSPRLATGNSPAGYWSTLFCPYSCIVCVLCMYVMYVCIYVCICIISRPLVGPGVLKRWLATGKSPAGYWSTVIGIIIINCVCMNVEHYCMYANVRSACHLGTLLAVDANVRSACHLGTLLAVEVSLHIKLH